MKEMTTEDTFNSSDKRYLDLLNEAKHKISTTRVQITKAATRSQSELYWWFGQHIIEAQEKHGWGKSVIEHLAKDLRHAFPETTHGFSPRNLWDMRRFYIEYKELPNLRGVVAQINN